MRETQCGRCGTRLAIRWDFFGSVFSPPFSPLLRKFRITQLQHLKFFYNQLGGRVGIGKSVITYIRARIAPNQRTPPHPAPFFVSLAIGGGFR